MTKLDSLALAIARVNDWLDPESVASTHCNPGLLKAYKINQPMDADQVRIFSSPLDGLQALIYDLEVKCSGRSRSKLKSTSTLAELAAVYGLSREGLGLLVKTLKKSDIPSDATLITFLE